MRQFAATPAACCSHNTRPHRTSLSRRPEQVREYAGKMLGGRLVTKQTGPEGQLCTTVLINEGVTITRELYFAILLDRKHNGPVIVASTQGGMDIEEVRAIRSPRPHLVACSHHV